MGNILSVAEQPNFGIDSVPIVHLGHVKKPMETAKSQANLERSARIKERRKRGAKKEEKKRLISLGWEADLYHMAASNFVTSSAHTL